MFSMKDLFNLFLCIFILTKQTTHGTNCSISYEGHADCRNHGYLNVPDDIEDRRRITSLNLYGNNIDTIGKAAFITFEKMAYLNLSNIGLKILDEFVFIGVERLEILDLSFNPVLQQLPGNLFKYCPNIKSLFIVGYPVEGKVLATLENLISITMTPHLNSMPYDLIHLPKLRIMNFALCPDQLNLTKMALQPFSKARIVEMAFHSCNLHVIENRAFDNFRHLRLLNLACNPDMQVNQVFKVLSSSKNVRVEDLILDLAGTNSHTTSVLLGPNNLNKCYSASLYIKNLSCRGINLLGFRKNFTTCFPKLVSLSVGFNNPYVLDGVQFGPNWKYVKLRYVDMSYMMVTDRNALKQLLGFHTEEHWIPPNKSYFPARVKQWESYTPSVASDVFLHDEHIYNISLPPNLVYIRSDHVVVMGKFRTENVAVLVQSNLRYINVSYHLQTHDIDVSNITFYGMDKLEILDIRGNRITRLPMNTFKYCQSLRELYISQNKLGKFNIQQFPSLSNLQILDLSENGISFLKPNTFALLVNLRKLYLLKNEIASMDFFNTGLESLRYLDMNGNKVLQLSFDNINVLKHHQRNFTLDLRDNPIQCNCDHQDMIEWIQATDLNVVDRDNMICHDSFFTGPISTINLHSMRIHCEYNNILLATLTPGVTLLITAAFLVMYKYRWTLRWYYYKSLYYRNHKKEDYISLNSFSTFIIYPFEDDEMRNWTVETLRKRIEHDWDFAECFLKGRNDAAGHWDFDVIVEGLLHCETALWVICPSFFEDKWCQFASNFAVMHLGVEKNAFLVMDDSFESYTEPKHLKKLMTNKFVNVLRYTREDDGQSMFWAQLKDFLCK